MRILRIFAFALVIFGVPMSAFSEEAQIAPGGAGVVFTAAVYSEDPSIMFFGMDVGGLFRTQDGGVTFEKVFKGLKSKQIHDIHIRKMESGHMRVFLATSDGLYISEDRGESWHLKEEGFEREPYDFSHPVFAVRTAPSDSKIVWATIGEAVSPIHRPNDRNTVYKSADGGETWSSVLWIGADEGNKKAIGPLTTKIAIHPMDPNTVFIASNRGLYATYDGGESWYELGRNRLYTSSNGFWELAGEQWKECGTVECRSELTTRAICDDPRCLPLPTPRGDGVEISHATLNDIAIHLSPEGEMILFTVLDDVGHMGRSCSSSVDDRALERYTGGPYRSDDGGLTWRYIFEETKRSQVPLNLRCNDSLRRSWNGTYFNNIAVNPEDPSHLFITAEYMEAGILELYEGEWTHHSTPQERWFEGGSTQGAWGYQAGPTVFDFEVVSWKKSRPDILFTHSRGAIIGRFDEERDGYLFDHLDSNYDPKSGFWAGTGLTDYCVLDMTHGLEAEEIYLAGQDSGVVYSADGGRSWIVTDGNADNNDDSFAIVRDDEAGLVYASRFRSRRNGAEHNVSVKADGNENWETIGGYCGKDCKRPDNGLPNTNKVYELILDPLSDKSARKLYAGTAEGLYQFDPTLSFGQQWSRIEAPGCPGADGVGAREIRRILIDPRFPERLIFPARSKDSREENYGVVPSKAAGVLVYNGGADTPHCVSLTHSSAGQDARAVHDLVLARDKEGRHVLVAAGRFDRRPTIFQTPINHASLEDVDWRITADYEVLDDVEGADLEDAETFRKKELKLAVNPQEPTLVLLGVASYPYFDHYAHTQIYVSEAGGELGTFRVATELDDLLPDKDIRFMRFSTGGDKLYVAPGCGGLYEFENPF